MTTERNAEVLAAFIEEARSYLPAIEAGLAVVRSRPAALDELDEPYRLLHSIRGASAMVGLTAVSHAALLAEELAEQVATGEQPWTREAADVVDVIVRALSGHLDDLGSGVANDWLLLGECVPAYRRLKGLPESGDEAEILRLAGETGEADAPVKLRQAPTSEDEADYDARMDQCPQELLDGFLQEAGEHLQSIAANLRRLSRDPGLRPPLLEVRRSVHTIKGAGAMIGLRAMSRLAHRMEDLLDRLAEGDLPYSASIGELLMATSDALEDLAAGRGDRQTLQPLYAQYRLLLAGVAVAPSPLEDRAEVAAENAVEPVVAAGGAHVRVPLERIEGLIRLVSELIVSRSGFERQLSTYRHEIGELSLSLDRLRRLGGRLETEYEASALQGSWAGAAAGTAAGLRSAGLDKRAEFDALEFDRYTEFHLLSRDLTETTSDLFAAGGRLEDLAGEFDSHSDRLGRLTGEVQDRMMRLRMLPLATLSSRLHRTVRVTAAKVDKLVDLEIEGDRVELDKTVLEEMAGPLEHLLRNCVDHGIEPPAVRRARGKPERGTIRLRAYHEGTQVVLQVRDDGAGLDPAAIRATMVRQGFASEEEAARMLDADAYQYVFQPGFSTARQVSDVSGRGIGMDVLRSTVNRLKGVIGLQSTQGEGATFTVRLPLTLALARVLLVRANQETFAVPLRSVLKILRIEPEQVERVGSRAVVRVDGQVVPALALGEALKLHRQPEAHARRVPVLLLAMDDRTVALLVDELVEAREVVVKTLGSLLRRVHGVTGATLMGDGSVVLIVNPSDLAGEVRQPTAAQRRAAPEARRALDVLVVDDSLSVRRLLCGLLQGAGWNPIAARDGLEALETLHRLDRKPDAVLVDVEMPRMDGYELLAALRGDEATRDVPVVMLTSRSGEKHRAKAFELGATDYLVKPYQDQALLQAVRQAVAESHKVAV